MIRSPETTCVESFPEPGVYCGTIAWSSWTRLTCRMAPGARRIWFLPLAWGAWFCRLRQNHAPQAVEPTLRKPRWRFGCPGLVCAAARAMAALKKFESLVVLSMLGRPELVLDYFLTRPPLRRRMMVSVRLDSFGLRPLSLACSAYRIRLGLPRLSVLLYGRINRLTLRIPVLSPSLHRVVRFAMGSGRGG